MRATYGGLTKEEIDMIVTSPLFPAWCFKMDLRMQQTLDAMKQQLDAAISADIQAAKERKERHARGIRS